MKKIALTFFLLSSFASLAANPVPFEELLYKGKAIPFYSDATDTRQQQFIDIAKKTQLAERMASIPQKILRLRKDIGVGFESCGTMNAFFSPGRSAIIICSEFVEFIAKAASNDKDYAKDRQTFVALVDGVIWGAYFHELAHAIISVNRVAITGREEDVADQFAVWFAVNFVDLKRQPIISPMIWFNRQLATGRQLPSMNQDALKNLLADGHSLDEQRIYNVACWSFGAGPEAGARIAQFAGLPEARAQRCPEEYAKLNEGIKTRFKKYFKTVRS